MLLQTVNFTGYRVIRITLDARPVLISFAFQGAGMAQFVRVLASHQCGPGSIPRLGVICGLSLLVLYSAPRCFSPVTPVFPLLINQNLI